MARSYKSALPTWSTYTPYVSPMGGPTAINAEPLWRSLSHPYIPQSAGGLTAHAAATAASQVSGGVGAAAVGHMQHQPLITALTQGIASQRSRLDDRRNWAAHVREAMGHHAPERLTAEGEHEATTPMVVRAERTEAETAPGRTAVPTVSPSDVATKTAMEGTMDTLASRVVESPDAGTSTGPGLWVPSFKRKR